MQLHLLNCDCVIGTAAFQLKAEQKVSFLWHTSVLVYRERVVLSFVVCGVFQEDEFRRRREAMIAQQRREAYNVLRQLEEMRSQPPNGIVSTVSLSVDYLHHCWDQRQLLWFS